MKRVAILFAVIAVAVIAFLIFRSPAPIVSDKIAPPIVSDKITARAQLAILDGGAAHRQARTLLVRGAWGSAPGQFGHRRDPESNPEGPMALAMGARGEAVVLDQINHRVQRFLDGKLTATLSTGGDTIQDLALAAGGRTVLLDRLADRTVQVYGADGKLETELTLVGPGVPEGGGVTGVFADDEGIYVEREHATLVRVADASGHPGDRAELPGRPTRDGRLFITARLVNQAAGVVSVSAIDRASRTPAWSATIELGDGALHLVLLDSDRAGHVYLGADVGSESPTPPFALSNERIVVARITSAGSPDGTLTLPAPTQPEETFRPITVDDDGGIVQLIDGPDGVQVVRYSF